MSEWDMQLALRAKFICTNIIQNANNCCEDIKQLQNMITQMPPAMMRNLQPVLLAAFYPVFKNISENSCYKEDDRRLIFDTLKTIFDKTKTEKPGLFFNIYALLLFEIYNPKTHAVNAIHEEYKQSIILCMTSLIKSLSWDLTCELYDKKNIPKLSQMLFVVLQVAKKEQLRSLRISAIECLMCMAQVSSDEDLTDIELRNKVADVFVFFLPGIASSLQEIALEDEKSGHKVITTALRAWGRIVALVMQDYNSPDEKINLESITIDGNTPNAGPKVKWKSEDDVMEYLDAVKRNKQWYKETDAKLSKIAKRFSKLLNHNHEKVRLELADTCSLLVENCINTMPSSSCYVIEILISLTEDESTDVSRKTLKSISEEIRLRTYKPLLENLEDHFYNAVSSLPRAFNGLDEREQVAALNLLIGYINLFGKNKLKHVLHSQNVLKRVVETLMFVAELDKADISLLEEYTIKDFDLTPDLRTPWKVFAHFHSNTVKNKLEGVCSLFAKYETLDIVCDFLLDVFISDGENKKEATLLLNEILSGCSSINDSNMHVIKNVLEVYLEPSAWNLPLDVSQKFGNKCKLADVKNNVIQICLQVEGVGKIALVTGSDFRQFLLKSLYLVLERAGSGHPLIKAAGIAAVTNLSVACKYPNITELVKDNVDYFSYHVVRKINRSECNEGVLNVLSVVMRYSTIDILLPISDIIDGVLLQSCEKYRRNNLDAFLRVFNTFFHCLHRWLKIEIKPPVLKTKEEKRNEIEDFKITGLNYDTDFSDKIMGKSAEEMWKEDMEKMENKSKEELSEIRDQPEIEEYKKPEPPLHIKLAVSVLSHTLNFLPSKERSSKLLVLEILRNGVELIKDYEDDLLPIVHKIWSPLIDRFQEFKEPLIINYSFQLLCTLAKVSKDFIRARTIKDVLPNILKVSIALAKESYLKDYGSAYRYTQSYKLQLVVLQNLAELCINLDVLDEDIEKVMNAVRVYLSNKQPLPLQEACKHLFKTLMWYDEPLTGKNLQHDNNTEYQKNISEVLQSDIIVNKCD